MKRNCVPALVRLGQTIEGRAKSGVYSSSRGAAMMIQRGLVVELWKKLQDPGGQTRFVTPCDLMALTRALIEGAFRDTLQEQGVDVGRPAVEMHRAFYKSGPLVGVEWGSNDVDSCGQPSSTDGGHGPVGRMPDRDWSSWRGYRA